MGRMSACECGSETQHLALDAEKIELPANSFDLVFASEFCITVVRRTVPYAKCFA
jgi:hypothetical protein